jgi:hypothetical protein
VFFQGRLEGAVTITPLTPPNIRVAISATGSATQLGRFTLSVPHDVDRSVGTANGFYHFTAANGDTLDAEFTGQSTLVSPGILSIVENATITGGTGRFAGAAGSFTAARVFDTIAGTTTGTFEGAISTPTSAKP